MTNQGAQAKKQTSQTNGHPLTGNHVDLDALLADHNLDPVPVTLKGKTYLVRRDLTGTEVTDCWAHINASEDTEAMAMLIGSEDAAALNVVLESLPLQHMKFAVRKFLAAAEMVDDTEDTAGK